jgi:hypothetical protein
MFYGTARAEMFRDLLAAAEKTFARRPHQNVTAYDSEMAPQALESLKTDSEMAASP